MDRAIHNGANVSICTQSEEERLHGHQIIEHLNDSMLRYQRNYDFQIEGKYGFQNEGSEADALIKEG